MMKRLAAVFLSLVAAAATAAAQTPPAPVAPAVDHEADHQQLRALLVSVRDAINARKLEMLDGVLADHFAITLADGQLVTDPARLKAYYTGLLAPQGPLRSLTLNPVADELTEFVASDVGICHGTSEDSFVLADGKTRVLKSRWTATLVKQDGSWKLKAFQAGANVLDNVILDEHKRAFTILGTGGLVAALLVGVVAFVLGRRSA
jgi:Domain of unknown function (DUF4440)